MGASFFKFSSREQLFVKIQSMQKTILYYKFAPVKDPESVRLWQRALCEKLNLKGRIIISDHGINGTLAGDIDDLKSYVSETKSFNAFKGTKFKWSGGNSGDFPKLSIKVRDEIVTFGASNELKVDDNGIIGGGKHLSPAQVHSLIEKRGKDEVVFFDGRNNYEAAVGRFKDAVVTEARNTRDFKKELDDPKYEKLKDKAVVTYCTGGIRCEVLSMLMINKGFKEVYQIDGSIVKYGEKYRDKGFWEGSLYVFDGRMGMKFSEEAKDIGKCSFCNHRTSRFINCANKACNELIISCENCVEEAYCNLCKKLPAESLVA
jgi:UPF0176 protein